MTEAQKDTIYVDVDDEITGIIDKVNGSKNKIVALVLPKRATVLQSVVNMKLLKRSAETSKKSLVLITSEAGLLPLAGAVGLHVAKNLQSKPAIPAGPDGSELPESLVHEEELEAPEGEPDVDPEKSVGELSGEADDEPIDIDNTGKAAVASKATKPKGKKDKNLKVPNFERFRKWLIIGGIALVVLLVGGYFAFFRLPKATITIDAESSEQLTTVAFVADTSNGQFNEATNSVPAVKQEIKKTDTQTAPATGQKNNGAKATGNVTMTARNCNGITTPPSVPAGTGVSSNGLTYITQSSTSFSFDQLKDSCVYFKASATAITAQNGGASYNNNSASFAVSGRDDVTAQGSASGGTDDIIKVVSQADVDAAKAKINPATNEQAARQELTDNLKKANMSPVKETFATKGPDVTATPSVGDKADTVTVNAVTTYSMVGVNQANLGTLVTKQAEKQIDTNKQSVLNDGLDTATFTVQENGVNPKISVQSGVTIGPKIDIDQLKNEIAGKKKGETMQIIQSRPGIKEVNVKYSPFWVTKTPKNTSKITIVFNKASDSND